MVGMACYKSIKAVENGVTRGGEQGKKSKMSCWHKYHGLWEENSSSDWYGSIKFVHLIGICQYWARKKAETWKKQSVFWRFEIGIIGVLLTKCSFNWNKKECRIKSAMVKWREMEDGTIMKDKWEFWFQGSFDFFHRCQLFRSGTRTMLFETHVPHIPCRIIISLLPTGRTQEGRVAYDANPPASSHKIAETSKWSSTPPK